MALMRRADTVFALDGFEEPDSSSSEEQDPKITGDPLIQNRTIQRGILKTKLEPELWTKRFAFRFYLMVISLVNVQIMALRADFGCHSFHCPDASVHTWEVLENIVTVFFVVDMAVRMIEAKPKRFFKGDESKDEYRVDVMNVFDFIITIMRCLDLWFLSPLGRNNSGFKFASVFRIVHISQFISEIQLWKGFRELWIVISLLRETLLTLFWVGFLIAGTTWVCSVLITISILTDPSLELDLNRAHWTVNDYWGSVGHTVITMFQVLLRDQWADAVVWPLVQKDPMSVLIFIVFYCVVVLALMNNVTGVVVECAMEASTVCGELYQKEQDKQAEAIMSSLRQIFREADADESGDLDREELRIALRTLRVRDRLKVLQIPFRDLEMLFMLLDEDNRGVIKCDYFFRGVAKLRGLAKAKDLHQLSIDLNRRMLWVDEYEAKVSEVNDVLVDMVDALDELDTHIVKGDKDDRDPVVAARRSRPPVSKGRILRGVWKDGRPMQQGSKNPWFDFDELQKEAKDQKKKLAQKRRSEAEARKGDQQKPKKKRRDSDQPSPPPLPAHLQILKEERDRRRVERSNIKQKKKAFTTSTM